MEKAKSRKRRWMVVDDSPDVLAAVALLLGAVGGADIRPHLGAETALAEFAAEPEAYELILTDLDMPGMSGVEFGAAARRIAPGQRMILATGSSEITRAEALAHGFCGYLRKPFPLVELLDVLAGARVEVKGEVVERVEGAVAAVA